MKRAECKANGGFDQRADEGLRGREVGPDLVPSGPAFRLLPPIVIAELLSILSPVALIIACGIAWVRVGRGYPGDFVTRLVTEIGSPCLTFSALTRRPIPLDQMVQVGLAAALTALAAAIVGAMALRAAGIPARRYVPTLMLPNTGNMGLPVCLFAFGEHGLSLAIAFMAVITVLQHTVGVALASGEAEPMRIFRQPVVWAVVAAVLFISAEATPPRFLADTTATLGGLAIPLMLLSLGVSLAKLQLRAIGRGATLGVGRLALGIAAGSAVAWGLGLPSDAAAVVIVQAAMPAAVMNYLYALRFDGPVDEVAAAVVVSTALSFATLPVLLVFLLPA